MFKITILLYSSAILTFATAQVPGGEAALTCRGLNSEEIKNYTQHAVAKLNLHPSSYRDNYYRKLINVLSGTAQIVTGTRFKLSLFVGKTNCSRKGEEHRYCVFTKDLPELYMASVFVPLPYQGQDEQIAIEWIGEYNATCGQSI